VRTMGQNLMQTRSHLSERHRSLSTTATLNPGTVQNHTDKRII
jgi:hypothetical protein